MPDNPLSDLTDRALILTLALALTACAPTATPEFRAAVDRAVTEAING
jgi:hypothetical protein